METQSTSVASKSCTKCGELKSLEEFPPRKTRRDGRCSHCKECYRKKTLEWKKEFPDKRRELDAKWHAANREKANAGRSLRYLEAMNDPAKRKKHRDAGNEWARKNTDYVLRNTQNWRAKNPDKNCATEARRRARLLLATPSWASKEHIDMFYLVSQLETERTGIQHHVDHIIPLKGKTVCGLHVECNLQVLTAKENMRKNAKLEDKYLG